MQLRTYKKIKYISCYIFFHEVIKNSENLKQSCVAKFEVSTDFFIEGFGILKFCGNLTYPLFSKEGSVFVVSRNYFAK
jgi:hypothetical protein